MCSVLKLHILFLISLICYCTNILWTCRRICRKAKKKKTTWDTHIRHHIKYFWLWDYFKCFLTKPKMWKTREIIYSWIKFMEEIILNNIGQIFHSKKQTKYIVWFSFFPLMYHKLVSVTQIFRVVEGWICFTITCHCPFPPQRPVCCFFSSLQPHCLATNTQENMQVQFIKTS